MNTADQRYFCFNLQCHDESESEHKPAEQSATLSTLELKALMHREGVPLQGPGPLELHITHGTRVALTVAV